MRSEVERLMIEVEKLEFNIVLNFFVDGFYFDVFMCLEGREDDVGLLDLGGRWMILVSFLKIFCLEL